MGKEVEQNLHQQRIQDDRNRREGSSGLFCETCSTGLSRVLKEFNFRCLIVLILSLFLLVSVIIWILPHRSIKIDGYDAKDSVKLSARVQVYFRLQKPVSKLVPSIERLEYDINEEVGVPNATVAVLSMRTSGASNWTDVVFGVLSDPINVPINQVSLSVLRSSLVEVFLGESNLTLTAPLFGQPSVFEILKFPGGITVVPVPYASIWQFRQSFFSFTLNNSIAEILDNLSEFRAQLNFGLHLQPYEYVVVQLTNTGGSTVDFPVIVQASVVSDLGNILPQRLQQLAQTINNSHSGNLGLNNSVFGKVKSVVLSTYLKRTLQKEPPTPSPAPSPDLNDFAEPPISPSIPPTHSPIARPKYPPSTSPAVNSPAPSVVTANPPNPCGYPGYPISPMSPPSRSKRSPTPPHSNRHLAPSHSIHSPAPSHSKQSTTPSHSNRSPKPSHSNRSPTPSHSNRSPTPSPISPRPTPSHPPRSPSPLTSHSNQSPYLRHPLLPPSGSPLPHVSYGATAGRGTVSQLLAPSPSAPSPSPSCSTVGPYYREIWWVVMCGVMMFHILCWHC